MFSLPVKKTSSFVVAGCHKVRKVYRSSSYMTLSSSIRLSPIESCKAIIAILSASYSERIFLREFLQLINNLTGASRFFSFCTTCLLNVSTSNLSNTILVSEGSSRKWALSSACKVFKDCASLSTSIRWNPCLARK